jgi:serine/threonine kinase 16
MGCTWSGLDALVGAVGSGAEVWVNKRRFRIQRQLGEGGFAFVYLVREELSEQQQWKGAKDPSHASGTKSTNLVTTQLCAPKLSS